jgi:TRAP-type mannitol/chloroaromatic compound transport system permease small subunit
MRPTNPLRHNAVRDTMWLGKGASWLMIVGVIVAAALAAWAFR